MTTNTKTVWRLQTYYYGIDQLEHFGYSRAFESYERAIAYARSNATGSRYTITEYLEVEV